MEGYTLHFYPIDEALSCLQKAIRRGQEDAAAFWTAELHVSELGQVAMNRMLIMTLEDVGIAAPESVEVVATLRHKYSKALAKQLLKKVEKKSGEKQGNKNKAVKVDDDAAKKKSAAERAAAAKQEAIAQRIEDTTNNINKDLRALIDNNASADDYVEAWAAEGEDALEERHCMLLIMSTAVYICRLPKTRATCVLSVWLRGVWEEAVQRTKQASSVRTQALLVGSGSSSLRAMPGALSSDGNINIQEDIIDRLVLPPASKSTGMKSPTSSNKTTKVGDEYLDDIRHNETLGAYLHATANPVTEEELEVIAAAERALRKLPPGATKRNKPPPRPSISPLVGADTVIKTFARTLMKFQSWLRDVLPHGLKESKDEAQAKPKRTLEFIKMERLAKAEQRKSGTDPSMT
ncbi:unnamed protein product [Amoebophrya sp. A25]|nr:unnamed protein product [Amoebophrya sp. A25]|eukprot:GSA25T00007215001.1